MVAFVRYHYWNFFFRKQIFIPFSDIFSTKMKLFQSVQKSFAVLGITPNESIRTDPYNRNIWKSFIVYSLTNVLNFAFFFLEANSFREYTEILFVYSCTMTIFIGFAIAAIQKKKLFNYINNCEKTINESEFDFSRFETIEFLMVFWWENPL